MVSPLLVVGCGRGAPGAAEVPAADDAAKGGNGEAAEIAALESRRAAAPSDGASRLVLARYYAGRDPDRARALLGELAAIAAWDYPLDADAFAELEGDPVLARVRELLAARAPRPEPSPIVLEPDLLGLVPEGVAWDPRRRELLIGSMRERSIVASDLEGRTRVAIPAAQDGLLSVLGIDVDEARDRLWAVSTATPFLTDAGAQAEPSSLFAFDAASGATIGRWPSPLAGSSLNDLIVLADGAVVATDSATGALLRRPADAAPGALEVLAPAGAFLGPNGIVDGIDGASIVVADFDGLHRVTLADGRHELLRPPPGVATLGGIDGLERAGATFYGIQNVFDRGRVWAIEASADGRALIAATVVDADHPRYAGPTTGAIVDDRFLYLADAFLEVDADGFRPAAAGRRHTILGLPLARR